MKETNKKSTLDIGEVAKIMGVPTSTIRFYEEKGLVKSTSRIGLRRQFKSHVLEQMKFILLGQHAGLSLGDIRSMFTAEGKLQVNREFLKRKADEMEKSIQRLSAVRNTLLHVAKCSAPNHMECPKFQKLLRVAGKANRIRGKIKSNS